MNLMISNMSWYVCLFPRCIFRCYFGAEHPMELFSINLHVIMLPGSLYSRISWVEFKETCSLLSFSEPIFPIAWNSENFYLEGTLEGPDFIESESEAVRCEATCLSQSAWVSNLCDPLWLKEAGDLAWFLMLSQKDWGSLNLLGSPSYRELG